MRIGIDARMHDESGVGRYIRNLLENIQKLDKENDYYIFHLPKQYDRLVYHTNFKKVLVNFRWYSIAEQIRFPKLLNKYNLDLVHFPHFNVPIFYRGKFVVTIHDLIHQHFDMNRSTTLNPLVYKLKQFGYRKVFSNAIKKSEKIITVSNFVRGQLEDEWKVNEDKIIVTHEAVEGKIIARASHCTQKDIEKVLKKFNINPPFIFYVGNAHPHKNIEGLIKAFLELRKKYQYLQLVLSGSNNYFWQRIKQSLESRVKSRGDIIFTGFVTDKELVALYKSAKAFVMPSFEEGFGIPLLEAMACGCPVVSSNAGALPEVGGDASIYFDPSPSRHPERPSEGSNDLIEKISLVLNSPSRHPERPSEGSNDLRNELISKGEKRYKQFSWEKLAKETLNLYEAINL